MIPILLVVARPCVDKVEILHISEIHQRLECTGLNEQLDGLDVTGCNGFYHALAFFSFVGDGVVVEANQLRPCV